MGRISPTDLPQPIYPSDRGASLPRLPPGGGVNGRASLSAPVVVPPSGSAAAPSPAGSAPSSGGPRRPVVWVVAAAATAVVVVVVAAVVALAGGRSDVPPTTAPAATGGGAGGTATGGSAQTSSAVNKLVSGVQLTNSEYRCVYDGVEARSGLAADIDSGSYDTTAAADVIAGCVSPGVIADLVGVALEGSGVAPVLADCVRTELASMSEASLAVTVKALLDGDSNEFSTVLATEASFCFQSS